jgi:lipid-binding SYLF domain-containing protein
MPRSNASARLLLLLGLTLSLVCGTAQAAREILDAEVNVALDDLYKRDDAARDLGQRAAGILVFPRIYKAGIFFGGTFGDGTLRVQGKRCSTHRATGCAFGLQLGAQIQTQVVMFMTPEALAQFRASENWQAGSTAVLRSSNSAPARA